MKALARAVGLAGILPPHRRRVLRDELLLSLELVALAAFAFSRPVLDSFGRSPETFLSRDAAGATIIVFGLVVTVVPAACAAAIGVAARRLGGRLRPWTHPVVVGAFGGIGVWRLGQDLTGWPADATKLLLAGPLAGAVLVVARLRVAATATFLRLAGATSVAYLVLFLVASPASDLVTLDIATPEVEPVAADHLDDTPDVVLLVFDGLPLGALLDGTGQIDRELYPHLGALAGDGTWYRNNTTVAGFTMEAVPALLTGRYPTGSETGLFRSQDPENLFTLLGGTYQAHVKEQVTALCPTTVCPTTRSADLRGLLGDAVDLWTGGAEAESTDGRFVIPGLVQSYEDAESFVDELGAPSGEAPQLVVHHLMLPHSPWRVTDDGTVYSASDPATGHGLVGWGAAGTEVAHQRLVLQVQAADRLLGRHLDRLHEAGTYDDTLVVVTSDHGVAIAPHTPSRALTADNYAQIMWTPLIVKEPGQASGTIDDSDVRSVDVVPTIADVVGIDPPWPVDGEPAGTATDRDGRLTPFHDSEQDELRSGDGATVIEVDAVAGLEQVLATDAVEWTGPDAVWRRTVHGGLVGRDVDELEIGPEAGGSVAVDGHEALDSLDGDEPPPIEVVGRTELPPGTCVAYALNGTVGAVTEVEPDGDLVPPLAHGLLPPRLFVEGANDLTAYVVEGSPGAETLHPLAVSAA